MNLDFSAIRDAYRQMREKDERRNPGRISLRQMVHIATRYELEPGLIVDKRGNDSWAVVVPGGTLNKDFQIEPEPESPDEAYLSRNRFELVDALWHAHSYRKWERKAH